MTLDRRARAHRRASARQLRADLTTMIAVAGLVATAGFGWLASLTYAGSPATSTTGTVSDNPGTVATPTPTNDQTTSGNSTTNGSSSSGASNGSSSSSSSGSTGGSTSGRVSRSSGRSHITSGSS